MPMPDTLMPVESSNESAEEPKLAPVLPVKEYGGREGPEPTRYGDWEKNGRCIDF
jgi:hypothetical protein